MRLIAMGVGESKARPATYPLLVMTPPQLDVRDVDDMVVARVSRLVRIASLAGLFPIVTMPGHE